jgi:hypothetical protein
MYELFEGSSILTQKGELIGIICREVLHFRWSWRMCKVKMLGVGLGDKDWSVCGLLANQISRI